MANLGPDQIYQPMGDPRVKAPIRQGRAWLASTLRCLRCPPFALLSGRSRHTTCRRRTHGGAVSISKATSSAAEEKRPSRSGRRRPDNLRDRYECAVPCWTAEISHLAKDQSCRNTTVGHLLEIASAAISGVSTCSSSGLSLAFAMRCNHCCPNAKNGSTLSSSEVRRPPSDRRDGQHDQRSEDDLDE